MRDAIKTLILVATASLIYFKPITVEGRLTLESLGYRSDFVFLLAAGLGVVYAVLGLLRRRRFRLHRRDLLVILTVGTYVALAMSATLLSIIVHDLGFDLRGLGNLFKTLLGMMIFVVTYALLRGDGSFYRWLAMALYLPPLIPLLLGAFYLSNPSGYGAVFGGREFFTLFPVGGDVRFQGLTSNPFQLSVSNFVAINFVWLLALRNLLRRRWGAALAGVAYVGALAFFILLSMTRAGVLLLLFALVFGAAVVVRYAGPNASWATAGGVVALFMAGVTLLLLPGDTAQQVVARFAAGDERLHIWTYYAQVALANPLGVGFNYEQRFLYDTTFQQGVNVHNGFLVAWIYGGALGFASVLWFLWLVLGSIRRQFREKLSEPGAGYYAGAVAGFLGFWLLALFLGLPFEDFTHGILLAMVLAGVPDAPPARSPAPHPRPDDSP